MKGLSTYVTFTSVRILVLCAGIIHGGCLSEMFRVGHLCYKWYASAVSVSEANDTCTKEGGHLAGFENGNFLTTLQKNPKLEEYLPKENCYWAKIPLESSRVSRLSSLFPVLPGSVMEGTRIFYDLFLQWKICYDKTKWVNYVDYTERRAYFVCEHEVSLFEEDRRRRNAMKVKVVVVEKDSTFIADQPLFEKGAPVPTMCSRLCQGFTGCSMFNYNKLTKQCRGFGRMEEWHIHSHQDWDVWVFK